MEPGNELTSLLSSHRLKRLAHATGIADLDNFRVDLSDLNDFYFDGRYPGDDYYLPTDADAVRLYGAAKDIVALVDREIDQLPKATKFFTI